MVGVTIYIIGSYNYFPAVYSLFMVFLKNGCPGCKIGVRY